MALVGVWMVTAFFKIDFGALIWTVLVAVLAADEAEKTFSLSVALGVSTGTAGGVAVCTALAGTGETVRPVRA